MKKADFTIMNVYDYQELISRLPYGAENHMDIAVGTFGCVHDVGTIVTLNRVRDGHEPKGWETLKADFEDAIKHCNLCWKIAAEYGYH